MIASSFQTLPSIFERHLMVFDRYFQNNYLGHFPNLFTIFRIPNKGSDISTPFQLGILHSAITSLALAILFLKRKKFTHLDIYLTLLALYLGISLFFMSKLSIYLWKSLLLSNVILFPWRFLNPIIFITSFACAYSIFKLKNRTYISIILITLVIFASRHYLVWVGKIPQDDSYYKNYQGQESVAEFTPSNLTKEYEKYALDKVEIIKGNALVSDETLKPNHLRFRAYSWEDSIVKVALLYFPGWHIKIDGKKTDNLVDLKFKNNDYAGIIVFNIKKGYHTIDIKFEETILRTFSNMITLITLSIIMFCLLFSRKKSTIKKQS